MRPFNAVVPPTWRHFDLESPIEQQVRSAVDDMVQGLRTNMAAPVRRELVSKVLSSLMALADAGTVGAWLPVERPSMGSLLPIIAVRPVPVSEGVRPIDIAVMMMSEPGATLVEPAGMIGVRRVTEVGTSSQLTEAVASMPPEISVLIDRRALNSSLADVQRVTRRHEYIIGIPDMDDHWMMVEASVSAMSAEGIEEALDAVSEFFDAWVETIEWEVD